MASDSTAPSRSEFLISRALFLRSLGLIYLIAFISLWSQIQGLVGSRGILPARAFLDNIHALYGAAAYFQEPTLCWLNCSDWTLTGLCGLGTLASVLLIIGVAPIPCLILNWILYLSLSVVGQTFLGFQWDTLLLEAGFLAIFYAPLSIRPQWIDPTPTRRLARWAVWVLVFKLMFLSGATKLLSGDPTWRDLTAMNFHYETQPLPNPLSWYAYQLPSWLHKTSVFMTFAVELFVPAMIVMPRVYRHVACALLVGLQVGIGATGNYGFFNLLSAAICIPLLDDQLLRRAIPVKWQEIASPHVDHEAGWRRWWHVIPVSLILMVSFLEFVREMVQTQNAETLPRSVNAVLDTGDRFLLGWGERYVLRWTTPFRTVNGYGLFRVMTTKRREIVVEASNDGQHWVEYEFRWKPGDVLRRLPIVAPHQPRLDWQMWFAVLDVRRNEYWLSRLLQRLLEGSPEVTRLMGRAPFGEKPPHYVRLIVYDYHLTTRREGPETWWQRTQLAELTGPIAHVP